MPTTPRKVNTLESLDNSRVDSTNVETERVKESVLEQVITNPLANPSKSDNNTVQAQNNSIDDNDNQDDYVKSVLQEQKIEIETLKKTIHVIESNQIEKDEQIDKLVSVCTDLSRI